MTIKNIKYILILEKVDSNPMTLLETFRGRQFKNTFEFDMFPNDEEALDYINRYAGSFNNLKDSSYSKIYDWRIEKSWDIVDELGRIKPESKVIQKSLAQKLIDDEVKARVNKGY